MQPEIDINALFDCAIASRRRDFEAEEGWDAIGTLHRGGGRDACVRALALCASADPTERSIGVDVLGQLGGYGASAPFRQAAIPALVSLLNDPDETVLISAIHSLGFLGAWDALPDRLVLVRHASNDVRCAMAKALGGVETKDALAALLRLSGDSDGEVRNWATFGIGTQCDDDTAEIRTALMACADDPHDDTRNEALVGLAKRRVATAIPLIARELLRDEPYELAIEAADEMNSPELIGPLQSVLDRYGDETGYIRETISRLQTNAANA